MPNGSVVVEHLGTHKMEESVERYGEGQVNVRGRAGDLNRVNRTFLINNDGLLCWLLVLFASAQQANYEKRGPLGVSCWSIN